MLLASAPCLVLAAARVPVSHISKPPMVWCQPGRGPAKRVRLQVMSDRIIRVTAVPGESLGSAGKPDGHCAAAERMCHSRSSG